MIVVDQFFMSTRDSKRRKTATTAMPANGTNGHANGNGNGVKKSIKVAGASGGFTDRQRSIADLAKCNVDFIVGDWMSECELQKTSHLLPSYKYKFKY